jgi:hypothetical protein
MKLVFKRNDEDAYCRANCRGKQKGNERNCSDDPRIVERGARTRLLRSASFHVICSERATCLR